MFTRRTVRLWLFIGLVMVFIQVLVGGITRLTESGLSITKWEIISGTIPPVSDADWEKEFELYKSTPQYKEINEGMSMEDFKFIYFWEYIHRFWARIMGFVFIIPFLIFWRKRLISKPLMNHLLLVILLAILAASFGWIMVASGLIERPWVDAYKLSLHLCIAFAVFSALWWTYLQEKYNYPVRSIVSVFSDKLFFCFFIVVVIQLFLGGMMSGMKIAVVYPSWPTMNGEWIPSVLHDTGNWSWKNLHAYDKNEFAPAFVQFIHRGTAYLIILLFGFLGFKWIKTKSLILATQESISAFRWMGIVLVAQVLLGIITVLASVGKVPVWIGVAHQGGALLFLTSVIYFIFVTNKKLH